MASYLPSVYLDYIRNKLNAYVALLKKLERDVEKESATFPKIFHKDIFFFMKAVVCILGTEKNLKIMHTVLLVVSSIISVVAKNLQVFSDQFDICSFLLPMAGLLLEEIANKETIQGKYLPSMLSAVTATQNYVQQEKDKQEIEKSEKLSLIDMFLKGKLTSSFVLATEKMGHVFEVFYKRSEYRDYILPS